MDLKNIFSRDGESRPPAPRIEVQGDEIRIPRVDSRDERPSDENNSRRLKLPKTTWFGCSGQVSVAEGANRDVHAAAIRG